MADPVTDPEAEHSHCARAVAEGSDAQQARAALLALEFGLSS
jgi:hypothetical protein